MVNVKVVKDNMKKNRLSYSQVNKYQECPKKYEYYYIKKIRSSTQSAALLFGSAMDKALEALVLGQENYMDVFYQTWEQQNINDEPTEIATCTKIVYANKDLDTDLLDKEDLKLYNEKYGEELIESIVKIKKKKDTIGFDLLPKEEKEKFNYANWLCLRQKGPLMIKAVKDEFLPKIRKVHSTQEAIELKNPTGDSIIGYVDLVAEYGEYPNPIVWDFKTSSIDYDEDSVILSSQLATYVNQLREKYNTSTAGYCVIHKAIDKNKEKTCSKCGNEGLGSHKTCDAVVNGKRCHGEWDIIMRPKARLQIIVNDIPSQTEEIVLENYEIINDSIKQGVFHRNFKSCKTNFGKCEYFDLCYKNNMKNLICKG